MSSDDEKGLSASGKTRVKVRTRKTSSTRATPRQLDAARQFSTEVADLPIERSRSETESGAMATRNDNDNDDAASLDESSSIEESDSQESDERQRRAAARLFVDRVVQRALAVELVRGVMQRAQQQLSVQ